MNNISTNVIRYLCSVSCPTREKQKTPTGNCVFGSGSKTVYLKEINFPTDSADHRCADAHQQLFSVGCLFSECSMRRHFVLREPFLFTICGNTCRLHVHRSFPTVRKKFLAVLVRLICGNTDTSRSASPSSVTSHPAVASPHSSSLSLSPLSLTLYDPLQKRPLTGLQTAGYTSHAPTTLPADQQSSRN
jgi:hypothetical protein